MTDELKRNGSGYYDPTAYRALKSFMKEEKEMQYLRGDIFEIDRANGLQKAVIVSNDFRNEHGGRVQIAYLLEKDLDKKTGPSQSELMCSGMLHIVMCEALYSVPKECVKEFVRKCTREEMTDIDRALMVALGLDAATPDQNDGLVNDLKAMNEQNEKLLFKLEGAERKVDELNAENAGLVLENGDLKEKLKNAEMQIPVFPVEIGNQLLIAETQRDMYKELYEQTLEKLIDLMG